MDKGKKIIEKNAFKVELRIKSKFCSLDLRLLDYILSQGFGISLEIILFAFWNHSPHHCKSIAVVLVYSNIKKYI